MMRKTLLFTLLILTLLLPASQAQDRPEDWKGFTAAADYEKIRDAYNDLAADYPEAIQELLYDQRIVFLVFGDRSSVPTQKRDNSIAQVGAIFKDGTLTQLVPNEIQSPTITVYLTEEALYRLATGEEGPITLQKDKSLDYEVHGLFRRIGIWWDRLREGIGGFDTPASPIALHQPRTIQEEEDYSVLLPVESCEGGSANALLTQRVTVRNCTGCPVAELKDICRDDHKLLERSCEGEGVREEIVDCSDLDRVCFEGACSRSIKTITNLLSLSPSERIMALSNQGDKCIDSDLAVKPDEYGVVLWKQDGDEEYERFPDFCQTRDRLIEFTCENGVPTKTSHECGAKTCFQGACRTSVPVAAVALEDDLRGTYEPCRDNDLGDDPSVGGQVTTKDCPACPEEVFQDTCETTGILREHYCAGGARRERVVVCEDLGYQYCNEDECAANATTSTRNKRDIEAMGQTRYRDEIANVSGVDCIRQRTTFSVLPGDARDRVYFRICPDCEYDIFADDCYQGSIWEHFCVSDEGAVKSLGQRCRSGTYCYQGACIKRSERTTEEWDIEEDRQDEINANVTCMDRDKGIDPRTWGRVELRDCPFCYPRRAQDIYEDVCLDENHLKEYYCDGSSQKSREIDCTDSDRICRGGACTLP